MMLINYCDSSINFMCMDGIFFFSSFLSFGDVCLILDFSAYEANRAMEHDADEDNEEDDDEDDDEEDDDDDDEKMKFLKKNNYFNFLFFSIFLQL